MSPSVFNILCAFSCKIIILTFINILPVQLFSFGGIMREEFRFSALTPTMAHTCKNLFLLYFANTSSVQGNETDLFPTGNGGDGMKNPLSSVFITSSHHLACSWSGVRVRRMRPRNEALSRYPRSAPIGAQLASPPLNTGPREPQVGPQQAKLRIYRAVPHLSSTDCWRVITICVAGYHL